ncbi:MAG: hypothetical protein R2836_07255 [Chitinophagales bacterium]
MLQNLCRAGKDETLKDFKHYNNTIILNGNEETKQNELLDTIVVERTC